MNENLLSNEKINELIKWAALTSSVQNAAIAYKKERNSLNVNQRKQGINKVKQTIVKELQKEVVDEVMNQSDVDSILDKLSNEICGESKFDS